MSLRFAIKASWPVIVVLSLSSTSLTSGESKKITALEKSTSATCSSTTTSSVCMLFNSSRSTVLQPTKKIDSNKINIFFMITPYKFVTSKLVI